MLSREDMAHLETFESRLATIRDRIVGVSEGWSTGYYLWGEGGVGKSYVVTETLRSIGANACPTNSRLTAKGLYELLERDPDQVHVIEDCETLLDDPKAAGVLRSALGATNPARKTRRVERLVTWTIGGSRRTCVFVGGIILVANRPLREEDAVQRAIGSRIAHDLFAPTNDELRAKMREVAERGYRLQDEDAWLTPADCREVVDFVVTKCDEIGRPYDLRYLENCFRDRLQFEVGHSGQDWTVLVESRIKESIITVPPRKTRSDANRDKKSIACGIASMDLGTDGKIAEWHRQTGLSQAAFYRALER